MIAFTLTLGVFAAWWLIGLALLVAVGADTTDLRIVLTAPVIGTAVTVLPLFVLSHAGVGMAGSARPVMAALLLTASVIVIARRPRIARGVWPVLGLCIVGLLLVGRPMFEFDLNWIANANDDMANYVLSATDLLHHGLLGPIDFDGLRHDRDYVSLIRELHGAGARPGADITLAGFGAVAGRPPYQLFMPLVLALNLCTICGTAALAMQAARRWWAAPVAALLLVTSPLAAYGVLAQLMPQVWGLGLVAALFALLVRDDLHRLRAGVPETVPVALLAVSLVVVYVELAAAVVMAYLAYVVVLVMQRRLVLRVVVRLWGTAAIATLVVLNSYFFRELHFVASQASGGIKTSSTLVPLFGYALVPSALAVLFGFQIQNPSAGAPFINESILVAIGLCAGLGVGVLLTVWRRVGASFVLLTYLVLGVVLAVHSSDFGLFKLYMYVQPFLAAAVAVWLSYANRRFVLVIASVAVVLIAADQVHTTRTYVRSSRSPIDLRHASETDLLPTFRGWFAAASVPVVSTTDNSVLAKLEAASTAGRPLLFMAKNFFPNFAVAEQMGWTSHSILTQARHGRSEDTFLQNPRANRVLSSGRCLVVLQTGSQTPINRYWLPEDSPDIVRRPCGDVQNLLVFTWSSLGEGFFLPLHRRRVSFYQLEHDYFYPGHTFAGLGRFLLFRVLDPSASIRLELDVTTTLSQDGSNMLPPADVVGENLSRLNLVGRGSARIFSRALRPQMIGGQPFLLLDMGAEGHLTSHPRSGLQGLYGRSIPLDPRYLTSYVRDISIVSDAQFQRLSAPSALSRFPQDLADPNLEYSGLYEDGWVAETSFVTLAGGPRSTLVVRGDALRIPHQRVSVFVNGSRKASTRVTEGALELHVAVPASVSRRRVALRFARTIQLGPRDRRRAAAHLNFIGLTAAPSH